MNDIPPSRDPPDDLDERYRRASSVDPSRPSESVRRAVLQHAAQLAAQRAPKKDFRTAGKLGARRAAHQAWWRPAIFGTFAAAALAGLLITPHYLTPSAPPAAAPPRTEVPQPTGAAEPSRMSSIGPPLRPNVSAETSRTELQAKPRVFAGNPAPQNMKSYTPPNESRAGAAAAPGEEAAAAAGAQNALARARGTAGARDSAGAGLRETAAPPAGAPMAQAARPTDPAAALRQAAESGDVAGLQSLLGQQVDIDARDSGGRTALMLATLHGQGSAVDTLLAHGADPNAADAQGTTPLQAALDGQQPAIAAALRRAGAR
ncbi:MAG: ankyrin repeat domain-containing protein [Steroidobacteraceae bacterium]